MFLSKRCFRNFVIVTMFIVIAGYTQDLPRLLIISAKGDVYDAAQLGITSELEDAFTTDIMTITSATTVIEVEEKIKSCTPKAIVLMDNTSIRLYKSFCTAQNETYETIPSVALLAIDVENAIKDIKNIQGISYETPMVTALVNLRSVLNIPIERVGVICRDKFVPFINEQATFCNSEKISIEKMILGDKNETYQKDIKKNLETFINKTKVQAIMVINDNVTLKPNLLLNSWIPVAMKTKVPFVVGVETLAKPKFKFGTFAVIPDARAAGEQAADLLEELSENDWHFKSTTIHQAIAVYTVLNVEKALQITEIKKINLNIVDKILGSIK